MRNKLVALLMISLMAILVAFVPQRALTTPTTWGPRIEHIRYPTYLSPDAQTLAMQRRDVEFLTDMIRPVDVEILAAEGRQIFAAPYAHFSYIAFNMKNWWLGPIDGSDGPGRALRHAMAHLVPKDELIGTGSKYIVTKIEAPGPVAQGEWYNSNVDPHPYDPQMAYNILINGGWTWDTGDNRWELAAPFAGYPAGTPMPTTTLYSPEFETAPTSWEIMRTTVERMTGAGPFATTPLPAVHTPIDFNVLLDILDFEPARSLSADEGGWDAYFLCYSDLGDTAEFLFSLHHSSQDTEKGDNQMHLHNDAVDAQLDIIKTSLDHSAKVTAAHKAYELLMGSTLLQYTPTTDGIIARIPIYSRAMYAATDEGLGGIVNMLLTGVDQSYTFANMYWSNPAGHESDLVPGGSMVIFCNQEKLQTPLSPAYASSEYSRMVMDYLYDGLIRTNPYYLERFAWILDASEDPDYPDTPGYYVETTGPDVPPGGMKVTYWLVDDTPLWHDGHPVDAFDVEFAWEFQKEYEIGRWWDTFMYFDHADVIDVPANRTIVAYMTATSQFTPFAMAEMALMFPEHIWGCTHERGGRATPDCTYVAQYAEMYDGTPVTVESGLCGCAPGPAHVAPEKTTCIHGSGCVIDHPDTPQNEVYAYDPTFYSHATPEFPWLSELVGTGGFVFWGYSPEAMVADIVAFDAARTGEPGGDPNVHYWKTTDEIYDLIVEMFWAGGDVNRDGVVDDIDRVRMEAAAFSHPGSPNWDPDCDLNLDLWVDVRDFARLDRNFGKWREYPADITDVAILEASTYPTAVPGQEVEILVKAKNKGLTDRTVNFTYYYDNVFIGYQIVTLAPCQSNVSFTWDTAGVSEGTYTIKVNSTVIDGPDIDLSDNLYVDGQIRFVIPTISVDPEQSIVGSAGKDFSVNINITNAPYNNTWAWQFKLSWNPALLNITDINEGTFLNQSGTWATTFVNVTNQEEGWILASCTLKDDPIGQGQPLPHGNGTLATINFTVLELGGCTLHLYDTILLDYNIDPYSHTTQDGEFEVFLGDINRDGIVDDEDLEIISLAFGSSPGESNWNPEADIWGPNDEPDGVIDVYDLAMCGKKYGKTP